MRTVKTMARLTIEEYLDREQRSDVRYEYVHGIVYAMVGGTERHNEICLTIAATLRQHLHGEPCRVFMSDMKVLTANVFYYPDVMVVCGEGNPSALYQTEPVLLVEVLSNSTEAKDRLEKLVAYQSIPSLREYALVSQDKVHVDIYRRLGDDWEIESLSYGDTVHLASVSLDTAVEMLYEDVLGSMPKPEA